MAAQSEVTPSSPTVTRPLIVVWVKAAAMSDDESSDGMETEELFVQVRLYGCLCSK
jgi:hypothetical protein